MGAWDTKIFGDDTACDVRDTYRELIEDGVDDADAMRKVLEEYEQYLKDPDTATIALVALAVTQSKIGRLDPSIRDRAVALIDRGGDLHVWERDSPKEVGKRKTAIQAARAQLLGPQPIRKRLKPPVPLTSGLVAGDVLALDLSDGPLLFRTVAIKTNRYGESPILEKLEYSGPTVPSVSVLHELVGKRVSVPRSTFRVVLCKDWPDWKLVGFRLVANVPIKVTDDLSTDSGSLFSWDRVAYRFGVIDGRGRPISPPAT